MSSLAWLLTISLAISGLASAAHLPGHALNKTQTSETLPETIIVSEKSDGAKVQVERSVVIETKSSRVSVPVRADATIQERVFLVFPESSSPATTEAVPETTTTVQAEEDVVQTTTAPDTPDAAAEEEKSQVKVAEESKLNIVSSSTSTTSTTSTTTTTTTEAPSTTTSTTPTPSSSTYRSYRGSSRGGKKGKEVTSTTTAAPASNSTSEEEDSSSSDPEEEAIVPKATPHPSFDQEAEVEEQKPAPRPSARLVQFLKNKKPGASKRLLHPEPQVAASTPSTSTSAPATTPRLRKGVLRASSSEQVAVSVDVPDARRARFFSSASSLLSGFVPSVALPSEAARRAGRASCANPAGCVSPDEAELLRAAVHAAILNNSMTAVTMTTATGRGRHRMRATAAPTSTTQAPAVRSGAQRLALGRRRTTTSTTPTPSTTLMTTSISAPLFTMKQLQQVVSASTPVPQLVQPTTFRPLYQRLRPQQQQIPQQLRSPN